tara:strand:- start:39 stop:950 length:912 start_codon:yes stop_codon:yes gene_type:complete
MTTNYEKKLLNEIKELKEGSVPKDILFADRAGHRREIAALQKENEELKRNGGFVGDYATAKSANALLARQKDSELKKLKEENEELTGEKEYWVKEYHDLKSKVDWGSIEDYSSRIDELITKNNKLYDENKKLKEENEKRFDKIKEMENEVGVSKLVHHQNLELQKENEKLKAEVELKKDAWCPELILKDLYENTNYKDPSLTIKDYIQKIEAENAKLKDEMEKRLLETQFNTWREGEIDKNGEVDPADDCAYLNLYCNNQELIKEIFDDTWGPLGWEEERNLSYDVETHLFEELPEYDKEADE